MQCTDNNDGYLKRKKKRSLNQRVKKRFKKSAAFSKGTRLDSSEHEYFMRVFELWNTFEGSNDDKVMFANNALAQTENREVECSFNQLVSHVIEELIPHASNSVLEMYFSAFGVNLRPVCVHDFASHVLQALMLTASLHLMEENSEVEPEHFLKCEEWILKISRFLLNNIEEFMWEKNANPPLRTAMFCLAGIPHHDKHSKFESSFQKQDEKEHMYKNPPEKFVNLLEEFYLRISTWPQFKELVHHPLASGYLQCLLQSLKLRNKKKYKSLCKKILEQCFSSSNEQYNSALSSPTALPVLEIMINQSSGKMLKKIYDQLLDGNLLTMATARVGNLTLQKFMNKCDDIQMVTAVVTTLSPEFTKILECGNHGVIVSLAQACERLETAQADFFQGLMSALSGDGPDNDKILVSAVLTLRPQVAGMETSPTYTRHGSLLLQSLLKFHKPIKLINSLLLIEPKQLAELFSTPYGCHIPGVFCKSEYIGEKSRQRLIHQLLDHYSYLAQSKFGSRSFDDLWDAADMKAKERIVGDLTNHFSELMGSQFGKFVASKVRLDEFRNQGVNKWRSSLQMIQSKKKLFAPLINNVK